jgi:glyoxylase-like metal-dependent hydrolase (beta-lactamase superfamily II)
MDARRVAEGVYQIGLCWSNVYLLTDGREAALIDTGLRQDADALRAALCDLGCAPSQVQAVFLTHGHCDHAGNAALFPAGLRAHADEAPYLGLPRRTYAPGGWRSLARPLTTLLFTVGEWRYPVARCGVDTLLQDGQLVDAPGGALRVVHCPGHTPGHVAYFRERDGLLFSGDALLNVIPIRRVTGLSLPPDALNADPAQTRVSARKLVELRPTALLAGHGWPLLDDTAHKLAEWARTLS